MPRPRRHFGPRRHPWGRAYGYGYGYPDSYGYPYPMVNVRDDCAAICAVQKPNDPYAQIACQSRCVSDPGYYLSGLGESATVTKYVIPAALGIGAGVVGYFIGLALKKR